MTRGPWTHPAFYAEPLTLGQRMRALKDWPAMDPHGIHTAGLAALMDFDDAVKRIMVTIWGAPPPAWPPCGQFVTYSDGRRKWIVWRDQ